MRVAGLLKVNVFTIYCYSRIDSNHLVFCYRSSFSDFASRFGKDERFKGIEKMRERENLFADYCSELRRREKEEKANQKEKVNIFKMVKIFAWIG